MGVWSRFGGQKIRENATKTPPPPRQWTVVQWASISSGRGTRTQYLPVAGGHPRRTAVGTGSEGEQQHQRPRNRQRRFAFFFHDIPWSNVSASASV